MKLRETAHLATFGQDCERILQSGPESKMSNEQGGQILEAWRSPMAAGMSPDFRTIMATVFRHARTKIPPPRFHWRKAGPTVVVFSGN